LPASEAAVWEALQRVHDPEFPLSVVDLGLVYGVRVEGATVHLEVTFTSIGCPAIEMIVEDIRAELEALPGVAEVVVEIVWGPPWTRARITDRGRRVLLAHGVVA